MITDFTMADGEKRFFIVKHYCGFHGYFRWNYPNAEIAKEVEAKLTPPTAADWAANYVGSIQLTTRSNRTSLDESASK